MVTTQLLTAKDLWKLGDAFEDYELIEGELVPMASPGGEHGAIQVTLGSILHQFVRGSNLGTVVGDAGFVIQHNPDTVLGPDLSFIARDRLPRIERASWNLLPVWRLR